MRNGRLVTQQPHDTAERKVLDKNALQSCNAPTVVKREITTLCAAFFLGTSCLPAAPGVAETADAGAPPAQAFATTLDRQELGYSVLSTHIPVAHQAVPFEKEPALSGGRIFRGTLQFQPGSNSIAFVWDRTAGKLCLDLNRNLDLTDDTEGIFVTPDTRSSVQTFTGIRLPFGTSAGPGRLFLDFNVWAYSSRPSFTALTRSLWQGKLVLHGQEWQVGIVENPTENFPPDAASRLLFRRWEFRDRPFNLDSGALDGFPLPSKLFVGGHVYDVACARESVDGRAGLKLEFKEQPSALGELKITGRFIQRLILEDGPSLVVLDEPTGSCRVPAGRYSQIKIWLKEGETEAVPESYAQPLRRNVRVEENAPAILEIGGPLTNSLTVGRRGKQLIFHYRLVGAGGESYRLSQQDYNRPPEFTVFKEGRRIASGKFEFG